MTIPFECSLPNRELSEFMKSGTNNDLLKYIPTEDSREDVLGELLRTEEEEAIQEARGEAKREVECT